MPDSQSSEPGFESLFVTVSKIGHFRSLHWRPCSLSCKNEYLAIDSGGNVSDLALARNCCLARMLPGVGVGMSRSARGGKKCKALWAVQRTGYWLSKKNYLYLCSTQAWIRIGCLEPTHTKRYDKVRKSPVKRSPFYPQRLWTEEFCYWHAI